MAENNSGEKIEKKLKNKMLEDISINSKQPMAEISNQIYMRNIDLEKFSKIKKQFNQSIKKQKATEKKYQNFWLKEKPPYINMEKISNQIYMNKTSLKKLSKSELINLLLKQEKKPKIIIEDDTKPVPARKRPIPTPRKSVKDMVQQYEDNIISPPPEFRDDYKPIPAPRTKKTLKAPIPTPRTKKPKEKRTIISQVEKALKGYTKSFDVELRDNKDPLLQLQKSRRAVEYLFNNLLVQTKGFKFVETLQVKFVKQSNDKNILKNGYFNSTTDLIINETDIKLVIQASQQQILNKIAQWISEGSGWTIQSIENHYINIVNYNPLKGSSYIKLPQELRNSTKGLINMKNKDNECFRWCHIRHLNPQDNDPQRIKMTDKQYIEKLDYSSIEFPVTVKQINKIEKQISASIYSVMKKNKNFQYISPKKSIKIIWNYY